MHMDEYMHTQIVYTDLHFVISLVNVLLLGTSRIINGIVVL